MGDDLGGGVHAVNIDAVFVVGEDAAIEHERPRGAPEALRGRTSGDPYDRAGVQHDVEGVGRIDTNSDSRRAKIEPALRQRQSVDLIRAIAAAHGSSEVLEIAAVN